MLLRKAFAYATADPCSQSGERAIIRAAAAAKLRLKMRSRPSNYRMRVPALPAHSVHSRSLFGRLKKVAVGRGDSVLTTLRHFRRTRRSARARATVVTEKVIVVVIVVAAAAADISKDHF